MRAGDRAYEQLLDDVQSGALAPGTVLAEVEQAKRLGISRTPLREAIRRLIADGLVVQQSPRVTVVSGFDARDIEALFEARAVLESAAMRSAAERGDRQHFAGLAREFTETGRVADDLGGSPQMIEAYYALIARFDAAVDDSLTNPYLAGSLATVRTHLARARSLARDNQPRLAASVAEHRLIAQAIADGDADLAEHATHVHLHHALQSILAAVTEGTP